MHSGAYEEPKYETFRVLELGHNIFSRGLDILWLFEYLSYIEVGTEQGSLYFPSLPQSRWDADQQRWL